MSTRSTTLRSPRIVFPAICVVVVVTTYGSWASLKSKPRVRVVSTIPLQLAWQSHSAPIDISEQEALLVFPWGLPQFRADTGSRRERRLEYRKLAEQLRTHTYVGEQKVVRERLLVWDYPRQQAAFEFPKNDEWVSWENRAPERLRGVWRFRFQGDGSRIVAVEMPWLVLIDAKKQVEIGRALPSESYLAKDSPGQPSAEADVRMCHLDVERHSGLVAASYNIGKDTHLYVYDSELKEQLASWQLPRIVQDVRWSPDGKKLAVLFNGWFNEKRVRYYGPSWSTPNDPDIWIIDARSGEPLVKFWTGSAQDQIAFSRDGSLVYVVNESGYFSPQHLGAIRAFSAVSGALVQTISSEPKGVHSGFRLSPDGSLIAADASTYVPQGFHMEPIPFQKISRVVLLDAKTGHLLFEYHERTQGYVEFPLGLAFSPDGRLLFVDFPAGDKCPYQRIEVYSIDGVNESQH